MTQPIRRPDAGAPRTPGPATPAAGGNPAFEAALQRAHGAAARADALGTSAPAPADAETADPASPPQRGRAPARRSAAVPPRGSAAGGPGAAHAEEQRAAATPAAALVAGPEGLVPAWPHSPLPSTPPTAQPRATDTAKAPRPDTLQRAALAQAAHANASTALTTVDSATRWQVWLPAPAGAQATAPTSAPATLWVQTAAGGTGWQVLLQAPGAQLLTTPLQALQLRLAQRGHGLTASPCTPDAEAKAGAGRTSPHATSAFDTPSTDPWP